MKCVFFCHALTSCWNNGNAHFLRGVARELHELGHQVVVYEPAEGWSRLNAVRDGGMELLQEALALLPGIDVRQYAASLDLDGALDGADLVMVHEWNSPDLIGEIGRRRVEGAPFTLLFHDTHHRAVTAPDELERFDLDGFDGVLAFGEVLRQIYLKLGWTNRAFTWHEAADVALYRPLPEFEPTYDVIWIGNWGDGERTRELEEFLFGPVRRLGLTGTVHGVRYPERGVRAVEESGLDYRGWLPNHRAPEAFAAHRATVHVPRGPYVEALPGIPTIRVFEALASGIPLVSAPWDDAEGLFRDGDFLWARDGAEMERTLRELLSDPELGRSIAARGTETILARHTCAHRVRELLRILDDIGVGHEEAAA